MAICTTCEEEYNDKRLDLGYSTCLDCGQVSAVAIQRTRAKQTLADMTPSASSVGNSGGSPDEFSPDGLFDSRPGYDYDWRRKISAKNAVTE
tara:strand:- start:909 stop:1184 length:276 start_codon:yes stop_codon:yes gene_type:complete